MRVLILEDHKSINDLIKTNIINENRSIIVDQCYTYDDACLMLVFDYDYDVLIVDIHLQDEKKNGGLFSVKFREKFPDAKIIVITGGSVPDDLQYDYIYRKENIQFVQLVHDLMKTGEQLSTCQVSNFSEKFNSLENRVIRLEIETGNMAERVDGFKIDLSEMKKEIRQFMEKRLQDLITVIAAVTLVGGGGVLGNYIVLRNMVKDEVRCAVIEKQHSNNANTFHDLRLAENKDSLQNKNFKQ